MQGEGFGFEEGEEPEGVVEGGEEGAGAAGGGEESVVVVLLDDVYHGKPSILETIWHLLVQSQNDPVRLAEDIEKSGRCLLLHLLRDTLLARRRDVRGLDVDRNAGLGSCVGGHVVVVSDAIDFKRRVIVFGRME